MREGEEELLTYNRTILELKRSLSIKFWNYCYLI